MGADGGFDIEVFSNEESNIFIVQFLSASWREKCGLPALRLEMLPRQQSQLEDGPRTPFEPASTTMRVRLVVLGVKGARLTKGADRWSHGKKSR